MAYLQDSVLAQLQDIVYCYGCGRKIPRLSSVMLWVTEPSGPTRHLMTLCQDCVVFDPATDIMGTSTFGQGITKMIKTRAER